MPTYQCSGKALTNAFDRVHHFLVHGTVRSENKKLYTLSGAINYSVGHSKPVMLIARNLVKQRLEGKGATQWLIDNGVPETELRGLRGFRNLRVWKALWVAKLAEEFSNRQDEIFTLEYPF